MRVHHLNACSHQPAAQFADGGNGPFAASDALESERLHAEHDDFRARFMAEFDQPFRQRRAGGTGETEDKNEEIATARNGSEFRFFTRDDFAGELDIAAAAEAVHELATEQVAIRHDGAFNRQLIGIEDPQVLTRPSVKHQLIAHRRTRLPETDDAHAAGE